MSIPSQLNGGPGKPGATLPTIPITPSSMAAMAINASIRIQSCKDIIIPRRMEYTGFGSLLIAVLGYDGLAVSVKERSEPTAIATAHE